MRRIAVLAALLVAVTLAACGAHGAGPAGSGPAGAGKREASPQPALVSGKTRCDGCRYVGVAAVPLHEVGAVQSEVGTRLTVVEAYTTFGTPAAAADAVAIAALGSMPFIQLQPYGTPIAAILAGRYDAYLRRLAVTIRRLGRRVAISFAAEANGDWYGWGCRRTAASLYIAAWRHIHQVMSQAGARNISWVWDVNKIFRGACRLAARWPGAAYVDWVGIDGYWRKPGDTYKDVLRATVRRIRALTGDPVLVAETGVPDVPGAASWISSLFRGARRDPGIIGIVYFDYAGNHGDYLLEDDPRALAAFRREARMYAG